MLFEGRRIPLSTRMVSQLLCWKSSIFSGNKVIYETPTKMVRFSKSQLVAWVVDPSYLPARKLVKVVCFHLVFSTPNGNQNWNLNPIMRTAGICQKEMRFVLVHLQQCHRANTASSCNFPNGSHQQTSEIRKIITAFKVSRLHMITLHQHNHHTSILREEFRS